MKKLGFKINVIKSDKHWKISYVMCTTCRYAKSVRVKIASDGSSDLTMAKKIREVKCHRCAK